MELGLDDWHLSSGYNSTHSKTNHDEFPKQSI